MTDIDSFRKTVLDNYRKTGREFPWRGAGPWGVMVSEYMLQQTQTGRVVPYWEKWMRLWPQPKFLAAASMEDALKAWSGLGYNRRCYNLRKAAAIITDDYSGAVPETPEKLRLLPGVGPYITGAIACFAHNYPSVFIETNIRSAVIHSFFSGRNDVNDSEIFPILEAALDRDNPRTWYYALMDYGVSVKKSTENPGRRSAHYTRQSPFIGSFRQARGMVIKALTSMGMASKGELASVSGLDEEKLYSVLDRLEKELLVAEKDGIYRIRD